MYGLPDRAVKENWFLFSPLAVILIVILSSYCHPEQSEGSVPGNGVRILRFAQDDSE